MGSKLPKHILRKKGLTMKQKWALHKRGSKGKKGSYKKASKGSSARKKRWGIGRYISVARGMDVLTRPAQAELQKTGWSKTTFDRLKYLYAAGRDKPGRSDDVKKALLKYTYGGIGTGLTVTYAKQRAGVYKGAGKLKILSVAQALSPEILAAAEINPLDDPVGFNDLRCKYDSGLGTKAGQQMWDIGKDTDHGKRFWADKGFNIALGIVQKVVFNTNGFLKLNSRLPKGINF